MTEMRTGKSPGGHRATPAAKTKYGISLSPVSLLLVVFRRLAENNVGHHTEDDASMLARWLRRWGHPIQNSGAM